MPRYGFSGQKLDMKKLILFAMKNYPGAFPRQALGEIATIDENADYFLFADALAELIESGLVLDTENGLEVLPRGAQVEAFTERDVPAALRRAVSEETERLLSENVRGGCVKASVRAQDGALYVDGELTDGLAAIMKLSLLVGGTEQAKAAERAFLKNAEKVYEAVLALLLGREE